MKNLIWKIFLTIMILIALYRVTSFSQTSAKINDFSENDRIMIYKNFELYQNEPDQFDEVTSIKFRLLEKGQVNLNVYDIDGKIIESLIDCEMIPGQYNIYFRPAETITSGDYYYKLMLNDSEQSKKMHLARH